MKKILIVDNHPIMLSLMENLLKRHGHKVKTAKDGLNALDILKNWVPDVIFLDLVMPNIGGDKLCQIIRKVPELKDVYIAIVSAVAVEEERDVTEFGADTCIAKGPFNRMSEHILKVLEIPDMRTSSTFQGKIFGIEHVDARDITRELLSVRDHFEVILERMSEGIIEITAAGRIVFANPAALEIIDKPEEEVLARDFIEFFSMKDRKRIESLLTRKEAAPEKIPEDDSVKLDGKDITLDFIPLKDPENKCIIILNDVTERKRMKAQIIQSMERAEQMAFKAEAANRAKSAFLASMSHEIRTPLNSVIGFTDMLLKSDLNEDEIEYAKTIKQSGEVLLSLINDILDFSKIEAGRLDLESYDFDLEGIIYHIFELTRPQFINKPIEPLCRIAPEVPRFIIGDASRFQQVLINLMGNAAKFTNAGEIELAVTVESEEERRLKLHVTVRDTGDAIPQEKLSMIFEAFQQADNSTTRKYGGTGLGLAICRKIAQLMNGEVWAESTPGTGNIFHFTAVMEKSEIQPAETNLRVLSGKKVLIVDDNKTQLDILRQVLEAQHMEVVDLTRAEEVILALEHAVHVKDPFHCCIIDIEMNACEVLKQIRDSKSELSDISFIAFAFPTEHYSKKCVDAGFDDFLPKPIRRDKLFETLERLLRDAEEKAVKKGPKTDSMSTSHLLPPTAEGFENDISILVAEDNLMSQKLVKLMFTKAGYQVEVAKNGIEVVDKYTTEPDKFDMIFMDVQMPKEDGLTATKKIRSWEAKNNRHIPIIAFTANAMKGDRETCLDAGMDDYLSKPIQMDIVLEAIKKWVVQRDTAVDN